LLGLLGLLGILTGGLLPPDLPAAPADLRVMTFNIRWEGLDKDSNSWEQRKAGVVDLLRIHAPDVFSLQEASPGQTTFINESLPNYHFSSSQHERSVYQPIFFRNDRFRLDSQGSFWLVEKSELQGGTRRCAWVRLVEMKSGRGLYIFNLHLDSRSANSRESSVVRLMEEISRRPFKDPFLVMGDFNAVETSPSISFLTGKIPLRDQSGQMRVNATPIRDAVRDVVPAGKAPGTAHGFKGNLDGPRIDYIFVSESITIRDAGIVRDSVNRRFPSDHFPVIADIALVN